MANFGALTDHFGVATTNLILEGPVQYRPVAKSRAEARDANGDVAAATWFGATDIYEVTCNYALISGTLNLGTLKLGELEVGTIVSAITVTTANGEWPKVSVTGRIGCGAVTAPTGKANTWTLPSVTLIGAKYAQPMGFTVSEGALTGDSFAFTCEIAEVVSGVGVPVAHGVSGAIGALTAELVNSEDTQPAWSLTLSGLTETQAPSADEPTAAYHTASAAAEIMLDRDSST